ncbi:MAG: hypothetical protein LBK96_05125 [Prevotellaceae bacterium]|jgi:hypothetical protein|nr:hypothetical protein [Prevotellaceae bacterium]
MAIRFSFFKIPQYKHFEYTPRIWDPEKEEREERIKQIQEEMGIRDTSDGKPYVPNIKGRFRKEYEQNKKGRPKLTYSNKIRSYIIIGTILLLCAIFFYFIKLYPYMFSGEEQDNSDDIEKIEYYR